jgi:hypothetical protein
MWNGARQQAAASRGRIGFAAADLSGLAIFEEALDHGVRAAEDVLVAQGITTASLRA